MIRKAFAQESGILTKISLASKKFWNYPAEFFKVWKDELTISPDYIEVNEVYVYETDNRLAGYYSLVELTSPISIGETQLNTGLWLEHMFILPNKIGRGIGLELFNHCVEVCSLKEIDSLHILADPNAGGFYRKMGCGYIRELPSSISGRTTPYFRFSFKR